MKCSICNSDDTRQMLLLTDSKKIFLCARCGNAFTYPNPVLPDYIAGDFHANGKVTEELTSFHDLPKEIQKSYQTQRALIDKYVIKGNPILEIGGGEGIFLDYLIKSGHHAEMNEPSLTAASRAMKRGIKVYNQYFQNASFDSKYDLVTMAHVLEHIPNPMAVLEDLKMILRERGLILLTQSNFRGFMPRFLKANWYAWLPSEHFSHFSISGIKYMAEKTNFELIDYKYSRLYHGKSIYHEAMRYLPFMQDQIHVLLKLKS